MVCWYLSPFITLTDNHSGSSAQVYGAVRNSNFIVQLDNLPGDRRSDAVDENSGILTEMTGISSGKHIVRITLEDGNGQLDFKRVIFDAGVRRYVT